MTVAERLPTTMTIAEFLAALPPETERHRVELIDGVPTAMVRSKLRHGVIIANLSFNLGAAVRRQGCRLVAESLVASAERDDMLVSPDLFVLCGPTDDSARYATNPSLVIEVLSPSTAIHDRGVKFGFYQSLASVQQILLVYADERRVESWTRLPAPDEDGQHWRLTVSSDGDAIAFPDLDLTLPLAAVYENTSLAS